MHKIVVKFWSIAFIAIGLAIMFHKTIQLDIPLSADETAEVWTVQARLSFNSNARNVKATLHVPNITPGYIKVDEHYISGKFGLNARTIGDNKIAN